MIKRIKYLVFILFIFSCSKKNVHHSLTHDESPCTLPKEILSNNSKNNLIINGDFQDHFSTWSFRGGKKSDTYQILNCNKNNIGVINIDKDTPIELRKAAYISRSDLPVEKGEYSLSFFIKTDLKKGKAGFRLATIVKNQTKIIAISGDKENIMYLTGASAWKKVTVNFKIKSLVEKVILQLEAIESIGSIYFSTISLEKHRHSKPIQNKKISLSKLITVPFKLVNPTSGALIENPFTNQPELVINNCLDRIENSKGSAIFIDYSNSQSTNISFPSGVGGWSFIKPKNQNFIYFESIGNPYLYAVSQKTHEIDEEKSISFQRKILGNYLWSLAEFNNCIYTGSYGSSAIHKCNLANQKISLVDKLSSFKGNLYARQIAISDDGWLLAYVGYEHEETFALNLYTGKKIKTSKVVKNLQTIDGEIYGKLQKEKNDRVVKYNSKIKAFSELPFSCPNNSYWYDIIPSVKEGEFLLQSFDKKYYLFEGYQKPLRKVLDVSIKNGKVVGIDRNNTIVGFSNQQYFTSKASSNQVEWKPILSSPPAVPIFFLIPNPFGGVTGGSKMCQAFFNYNHSEKSIDTIVNITNYGQIYDGVWLREEFYFACYSSGQLLKWSPQKKNKKKAIKTLAYYNSPEYLHLIRPNGGVIKGPNNCIFAGWSSGYGKKLGGISYFNPKTKEKKVWSSSIIAPEVSIGNIASDNLYIYGTTSQIFNGATSFPKPIIFWILDPKKDKIIHKQNIVGNINVPSVISEEKTKTIWLADDKGIIQFDKKKIKFTKRIYFPNGSGNTQFSDYSTSNGNIFFALDNKIIQCDLKDKIPEFKVIAVQARKIDNLSINDDLLYFSTGSELHSIQL